ncbi:MAG: CDP-alcohol phosphatidyltransferase family protein [Cyclobacteriaceae bacterium]|jgi:CDP-diacylglycerol--glycerol-3-phosphate 3-phosphatidyltransferase|nr:CDP-alcohol phosphatidyltransferase family protein [Cyclobacteriaceae bacterium]
MQDSKKISRFSDLREASRVVQLVNLITLYRIIAFPFLLMFIYFNRLDIFKWLIIISFFTDAIDGYLARKYKANSILGAKLDSIGDDLTILAAIIGLAVFRFEFLKQEWLIFAIPLFFFFVQLIAAFIRYGKMSSFHTYLAKTAAILQGLFLCSMFLFEHPYYPLFYATAVVTLIELIEEIFIVIILPEWKTNVKGLYWVWNERGS